jgi:nucleotide-binding universal stress UspA family protein
MFTNVIVPLDGSREATAALRIARTLAAAAGARLSLLRVVRRPAGPLAPHAKEVHAAADYLDRVVHDKLPSSALPVSTYVRSGDVAQEILNQIDQEEAPLIVMATRGHGGVVRAVLGSVASELLAQSRVPIVLVRADGRPSSALQTLLVPLDGSAESATALSTATTLAQLTGADIVVLRAVTPTPVWLMQEAALYDTGIYADQSWDNAALVEARNYVADVAAGIRQQGISAEGLALLGDAPRTITQTAQGVKADLIVMRTHARTGAARAVLGSVADGVVRSSVTPVMLLRDAAAVREGASRRELSTAQP